MFFLQDLWRDINSETDLFSTVGEVHLSTIEDLKWEWTIPERAKTRDGHLNKRRQQTAMARPSSAAHSRKRVCTAHISDEEEWTNRLFESHHHVVPPPNRSTSTPYLVPDAPMTPITPPPVHAELTEQEPKITVAPRAGAGNPNLYINKALRAHPIEERRTNSLLESHPMPPPRQSTTSTASIPGVSSSIEEVYVDGACEHNGQPNAIAGCGVWFGYGDPRNVSERLDGKIQTNQRAELMAATVGAEVYAAINNASCLVTSYCVLQICARNDVVKDVVMYSDSDYTVGTDML